MDPKTKELIKHITDGAIEGLKFIPDGEIDEAVKIVQEGIAAADFSGKPDAVKILEVAIDCGVIISEKTPTEADDKLFGKAKLALVKYRESGGNIFAAVIKFLAGKVKKD